MIPRRTIGENETLRKKNRVRWKNVALFGIEQHVVGEGKAEGRDGRCICTLIT